MFAVQWGVGGLKATSALTILHESLSLPKRKYVRATGAANNNNEPGAIQVPSSQSPVTSSEFPFPGVPLQNVCKFIKLKKFYELNWYNFHIIFEKEAKWNAARRRRRSIQPVEPSGGLSATHTSVFKMGECECVSVWGNANVCVWRSRRAGRRVWKWMNGLGSRQVEIPKRIQAHRPLTQILHTDRGVRLKKPCRWICIVLHLLLGRYFVLASAFAARFFCFLAISFLFERNNTGLLVELLSCHCKQLKS